MYQNINLKSRYQNLIEWGIENQNNLRIGAFLMLGFLIGFGIGTLINSNHAVPIIVDKNVKIVMPETLLKLGAGDSSANSTSINFKGGNFVASINGKAYYPIGCEASKKIKEENKIWFETTQEAESQGYQPAKNCPGF